MDDEKLNPAPFVLASIVTGYPDDDFKSFVGELLLDENLDIPDELKQVLLDACESDVALDDLRSEYIAVFDQAKSLNPLYETEYGRERAMFKANELSDIAGFYHAFGFEMNSEEGREMIDHVSVELEFYSLMLMKQMYLMRQNDFEGAEIVGDGMNKFMTSHLGRFVPSIVEREGTKNSMIYSKVFAWVDALIRNECIRIGAKPETVGWFDTQVSDESMCCGGTVSIGK